MLGKGVIEVLDERPAGMRSSSRRGCRPKIYFDLKGCVSRKSILYFWLEPAAQENLGERVQRSEPHTRLLYAPNGARAE